MTHAYAPVSVASVVFAQASRVRSSGGIQFTFLSECVPLSEHDDEIRGEALIGLARRHHPDALLLVRTELNRPFAGDCSVERLRA
jgi:hypothetical protein